MIGHTAIIIDDEVHARQKLKRMLHGYEEIGVIGEAANGQDGLRLIANLKPDVIFLDISMPMMNGFEMLGHLNNEPHIIFTTAHDDYALKAFEKNTVDYLLKPFDEARLKKAITKVLNMAPGMTADNLNSLQDKVRPLETLRSVTVTRGDRMIIIPCEDIVYFSSQDKCTVLKDTGGNEHLTYRALSDLAGRLPADFLQVHRSYIINKRHVYEIRKGFKGQLVFILNDRAGTRISTGKTFVKDVRNKLDLI